MKKDQTGTVLLWCLVCSLALVTTCASPKAPYEQHRNAQIDTDNSLISLPDSLATENSYQCTVAVILPDLIDSFLVRRMFNDTGTSLLAAGAVADNQFVFPLLVNQSGEYELQVVIIKGDASRDSIVFEFYGYGKDVAGFDESGFLTILSDSMPVSEQSRVCTAAVYFPDCIDSFIVRRIHNNFYDTLLAEGAVNTEHIQFSTVLPLPGKYRYTVYLSKQMEEGDSTWVQWDSLSKTVTAISDNSPSIISFSLTKDSLAIFEEYACTLAVSSPELVDSFEAVLLYNEAHAVIARGKVSDSPVTFTFPVEYEGEFFLKVTIYNYDGTEKQQIQTHTGYRMSPIVEPESTFYTVNLTGSVDVAFLVSDPDGNLWSYTTWIDSSDSLEGLFSLDRRERDTVVRSVDGSRMDTFTVQAAVMDEDSQWSEIARCTVAVIDTIPPQLSFVGIEPSANDTLIEELPCSLLVRVMDDSPVDSVKLEDERMILEGDSAFIKISSLDSGSFDYKVYAWDRAGNIESLSVRIEYEGAVTYPPQINTARLQNQTITENGTFDTLFLDSCVSIDPLSGYSVDDLTWSITEQDSTSGVEHHIDSVLRKIRFTVADSEWNESEAIFFTVTSPALLSDNKAITFTVEGINDAPVVRIDDQSVYIDSEFDSIYLDSSTFDPEDLPSELEWSYTKGDVFEVDSVFALQCIPQKGDFGGSCLYFSYFTGKIRIAYRTDTSIDSTTWTGTDTLYFRVRDSEGKWSVNTPVTFTKTNSIIFDPVYPVGPVFPKLRK
ncbi:MAG: hypothetical protein GF401_05805 [Chitinivibrionales bacterium]|nr:hypothetical protein [Chitinivibrionales bacterium]